MQSYSGHSGAGGYRECGMPIVTIVCNPHDMRDRDTRHVTAFRMAFEPLVDERREFCSRLCRFVAHCDALNFTPDSPPFVNSTPAASKVLRVSKRAVKSGERFP
jgi:hypothetical protein